MGAIARSNDIFVTTLATLGQLSYRLYLGLIVGLGLLWCCSSLLSDGYVVI